MPLLLKNILLSNKKYSRNLITPEMRVVRKMKFNKDSRVKNLCHSTFGTPWLYLPLTEKLNY